MSCGEAVCKGPVLDGTRGQHEDMDPSYAMELWSAECWKRPSVRFGGLQEVIGDFLVSIHTVIVSSKAKATHHRLSWNAGTWRTGHHEAASDAGLCSGMGPPGP